ncbi:hypothetical protein BDV93DRAFT_611168, partial [Ceratobasidium sp. AG-I]
MSHISSTSSREFARSSSTIVSAYSPVFYRYSNNANRVSNIPELLKMIASFLRPGDAFRLSLSSRACFQAAVGQIWDSLRGTRYLFALLPGFSIKRSGASEVVITLPDLPTCNFTRFDFYAPLVRCVGWYPSQPENIADWGSLISYAHSRPLLPELKVIELAANLSYEDSLWCSALCSFSVSTIITGRATSRNPIEAEAASFLFKDITLRCPALQVLSLCFLTTLKEEPLSMVRLQHLWLYESIGCMQNLRSFSASTAIFEYTSLKHIGNLLLLENLTIHGLSLLPIPPSGFDLPSNSFPALRKLRVSSLKVHDIRNIWNIQPLVARLATVGLNFCQPSDNADTDHLLSQICNRSPYVTNLSLGFINPYFKELSPNVFSSLQYISIKELHTFGINLLSLKMACGVLSVACPLLSKLQIGTRSVLVAELQYFSRLSQLRSLVLNVDWESCIDLEYVNSPPIYVSEYFRLLEWTQDPGVSAGPRLIRKTALFLLSFWPHLRSLDKWSLLAIPNYKFSTPWLVNEQLQAEQAIRSCRCAICLRRIHGVD